ncbi:MAG: hypothetical protein AMXMBFR53_22650 [Gemmatimonadota bacterium]
MRRDPSRAMLALAVVLWGAAACRGAEQAPPGDPGGHRVTFSVTVPEGTPTLYLAGNLSALGPWAADGLAMSGEGATRTATVTVTHAATFEYKFTLGSWDREGLGPSGMVMPNFRVRVDRDTAVEHRIDSFKKDPIEYVADWRGSGVLGTLVYWTDVSSAFLGPSRHVEIWLPPGYDQSPEARYPVIYAADGQNLFDPRIANTGVDWGVDEAMVAGVEAGAHPPAIVVGVWNSGRRVQEYSPWHDAPRYARFLVEELIPRVNAEFRTLTGPGNTFAMGSSMGGLLSFHLVKEHPEVFGACGCLSTHFPLSDAAVSGFTDGAGTGDDTPYVLKDIAAGETVPRGVRFSFDHGTLGLDATYDATHEAVRDWLLAQGLVEGRDFQVRRHEGADHNEASWRARLGDQLAWMLAPPR